MVVKDEAAHRWLARISPRTNRSKLWCSEHMLAHFKMQQRARCLGVKTHAWAGVIRGSERGGRNRRMGSSAALSVVFVCEDLGGSDELDSTSVRGGDEHGAAPDSGPVMATICTTAAADADADAWAERKS